MSDKQTSDKVPPGWRVAVYPEGSTKGLVFIVAIADQLEAEAAVRALSTLPPGPFEVRSVPAVKADLEAANAAPGAVIPWGQTPDQA